MATTNECVVCCENFNKTVRQPIGCPKCPVEVCKSCFETGLKVAGKMPHCLGCSQEYSAVWMYENLPKSLMGRVRKFVGDLDVEREKNLLPVAQAYMEDCIRADEIIDEAQEIEIEISRLKHLANEKREEAYRLRTGTSKDKRERAAFICPCPAEECNGFLNTKYKCTLCETDVCPTCRVILVEGEEHECKEDDVKTVEFIKSSTKPCPKCGTRIHRPGGCDHMFCTKPGCATSFSWRSGREIAHSQNTNPHYYAWRREQPGGLPRAAGDGDIVDWCGITNDQLQRRVFNLVREHRNTYGKKFGKIMRGIQHIRGIEEPKYRPSPLDRNRDLAVKFLKKEIDTKKWVSGLKRRRKKNELYDNIHAILEAFLVSARDIYIKVLTERTINGNMELIEELISISDKELKRLLYVFNSKIYLSIAAECKR